MLQTEVGHKESRPQGVLDCGSAAAALGSLHSRPETLEIQTAARRQQSLPQYKGFALNNNRIAIPAI
jgi:hypothetical protein